MEIKSYKKIKSNIYEVQIDNKNIKLYDDTIIKYNLLLTKNINKQNYNEMIKYNEKLEAYYISLKYISTKLRCQTEITKYLAKKNYSKEIINNTIERLYKEKYLNDELYIKSYINDKIKFSQDGPIKIKRNLTNLGLKEELIDKYLDIDIKSRIIKIIDKKVKTNKKLTKYKLQINISNYLTNLGYQREDFIEYLSKIEVNNKEFIEKDINKLVNKYKNKYNKDELIFIIKNKLYQKGYKKEEIGEILNEKLLWFIK